MAIVNQVGRQAVAGLDRSMKNYSSSVDIPAGTAVIWDNTSGNLNGCAIPATSATAVPTCGIAVENIPAGKLGRVCIGGTAVGKANATITAGQALMIDTTSGNEGKLIVKTTGERQVGIACHNAVAGDDLEVLVSCDASL